MMNRNDPRRPLARRVVVAAMIALAFLAGGCFRDTKNPVKHSGELARRGHTDLYLNGALQIPLTEVKVIPPGPMPLEIAREFIGLKARSSFVLAVKEAADSVYVLARGAEVSLRAAERITAEGSELARFIRLGSRADGVVVISRAWAAGLGIIGDSWELSAELLAEARAAGDAVIRVSREVADAINENLTAAGLRMARESWIKGALIVRESAQRSQENVSSAWRGFVVGYAVLPALAAADAKSLARAVSEANPVRIAKKENEWRKEYSAYFAELVTSAGSGYTKGVKTCFKNAAHDLGDYRTTGVSLASLKALRWVLKGILYDAVLKPVVKFTVGAVGYLGVNGVAYPVMVVAKEAGALTYVAVRLTWSVTANAYRLVAPSATLAVAAVFGLLDLTASTAGAGVTTAGTSALGGVTAATGKSTSIVLRTAGYAAGKAVQYIGVPLVSAGIAVTGTTVGAVVSVSGVVPGGALVVQGEAGSALVRGGSYVGAGVVLAGGTTLSAAGALGKGAYYVAKAGLVPTGYTLGTGVVMGYGACTQLAAHTLLGVADFAYLVLSLEGPRWVVYAIRGKKGKGDDLPPGTALDLKKMRAAGEEVHAVPVSREEMRRVVDKMARDLPVDARPPQKDGK